MTLSRLEDFEASSRRSFREHDLIHFEVYDPFGERVGQVIDVLVNEVGHLQYLVVEPNDRIATKQILISEGFQVDRTARRIYASQLNQLPTANNLTAGNLTDRTTNISGK